jgi:hypothetical protein
MIYYNVPGGKETAEGAYQDNEIRKGGHYPVGNNKSWHSGIHINTEKKDIETAIKPVIGGELVAYRINEDYQTIPLEKEISGVAYSKLNNNVRKLYREHDEGGRHILWKEELTEEESRLKEKLTENEYRELPEEMRFFYERNRLVHEIRDLYVWDSGREKYIPVKRIAANFILLRHEIPLPASTAGKIGFYTFYMGIKPGVLDLQKKYLNSYERNIQNDVNRPLSVKLPYYQKWRFKLIKSNNKYNYYIINSGEKKLFEGSYCNYSEFNNNTLSCKFENADNEEIRLPKSYIQITSVKGEIRYHPKEDRVSVYKVSRPQNPLFKIAELRETSLGSSEKVYFEKSIDNFDGNYYMVKIGQEDIYDDMKSGGYTWWCKVVGGNDDEIIKYENTISVYYKKNNNVSYRQYYKIVDFYEFLRSNPSGIVSYQQNYARTSCIIRYNIEKIEIRLSYDRKIVSVKNKNNNGENIRTIEILIDRSPVVIIKDPLYREMLLFAYNGGNQGENIDSYVPQQMTGTDINPMEDNFSRYVEKAGTDQAIGGLTAVCLSRVPADKLTAGEYIKIVTNNNIARDDSLPAEVSRSEGLRPCVFAWDKNEKYYTVLVRKENLKIGRARGYLKNVDEGCTGEGKLTINKDEEGIILYDGQSENSNVRNIIKINEEFEARNPSDLCENKEYYEVIFKEKTQRFVKLNNCEYKTGLFYEEGYGGNENKIEKKTDRRSQNEVLGYPNDHHKMNDISFYDLACFFTDKSFLDEEINSDAGKRYLIQTDTDLYRLEGITEDRKQGFFTWGSTFLCREVGAGDNRVYELTIKSIHAYIGFRGMSNQWIANCNNYSAGNEYTISDFKEIQRIILSSIVVLVKNSPGLDERVKWLGDNFENAWSHMSEMKFRFVKFVAGVEEPRFNFTFSTNPQDDTYLGAIWVKPSDIDAKVNRTEEGGSTVLEIKQGLNIDGLTYYEENPYSFQLVTGDKREGVDGYCRKTGEKSDGDGKKYIELQTDAGAKYYVPSDADGKPDGMKEINLLNWSEYFIVEESDNKSDLFCDSSEEIVRALRENDTGAREVIEREALFNGKITCEELLQIYNSSICGRYGPVVRAMRKLVCGHPLEWDAELYKEDEFRLLMNPPRFEKLKKEMELLDVWKGGSGEGIKDAVGNPEKNNFWFAHPVYFINHLNDAGLLPNEKYVQDLIKVQNEVMVLECLQQGAHGMYANEKHDADQTYCNHAVYLTIKAVDKKYKEFIGNPNLYNGDDPPWDYDLLKEDFKRGLKIYTYKSNIWCDILERQAQDSTKTGIHKILGDEAQMIANQGYVVIGAKKNENGHPHYVTVRPNKEYGGSNGPIVAHVGSQPNEERTAKKAFGNLDSVYWYYNRNQEFTNSFEFVFGKSSTGHMTVDVSVT